MKYMAILWCGCLCKVNHIFSTLLLWNIVVYLSNFAWRVADMAAIFFTTLTILIIYDLGHCIYINICVFFKTLKISMCNILAMFFQGCLSYILCPHVDYFASLQNGIQSTHSRFWPEREMRGRVNYHDQFNFMLSKHDNCVINKDCFWYIYTYVPGCPLLSLFIFFIRQCQSLLSMHH